MYRDSYNVDVLLFIEHKDRELEVILEIARKLKFEHGLSVAIASLIFDRLNSLVMVRPKVVVFPSYGTMMYLFHAMYDDRVTYVNLNWEQMLSVLNKKYRRPRDRLTKTVVKHCVWGVDFKKFLVANGVKVENVFITGKPATTLLKRKAADPLKIREAIAEKFQLDKNKKWLFFPMTCLHAFFDDYHVRSFISDEIDETMAFARRDYVRRTLDDIFQWIALLQRANIESNFMIILRPHPSVSVQQYEKRFIELLGAIPPYVHIVKELTAHEWLIASDICYTNYSSLALDGYSIGKAVYLLEPEPFPSFLAYEWFDGFRRTTTFEEFCESIRRTNRAPSENSKVIEEQFDRNMEGISRTAELIAGFVEDKGITPSPSFAKLMVAIARVPRQPLGSLLRFLAMKLYLSHMIRPGLRVDYFSSEEIRDRL